VADDPIYAEQSDLSAFGINPNALKNTDPTAIGKALASASRKIDSYLPSKFTLPLVAWDDNIKEATCVIAAYTAMSARGFNPESGSDKNIRDRYLDQIRWLERVASGSVTPRVTDSASGSAPGRPSARPRMVSSSQRGWSSRGDSNGPFGFQGD
jgi:phage gp36-like protein